MVTPSIEEEAEDKVEEDENALMNNQWKEQMEDWEEDSPVEMKRGIHQVYVVRTQQDRQEEEWSVPTNIERREDDVERCELSRAPPTPPPSEDRLFSDWSSQDSPRVRTSPQNVSVQDTEQVIIQPDNQTDQPGREPVQVEVMANTLNDDVTTLSTH